MRPTLALAALFSLVATALAADFPGFEAQEIDPRVGNVCCAVTIADVNGDNRPDVAALTEDAVVWFANPTREKHVILKGATERDNVCIQARDIEETARLISPRGRPGSRRTSMGAAPCNGSAATVKDAGKSTRSVPSPPCTASAGATSRGRASRSLSSPPCKDEAPRGQTGVKGKA